MIIAEWTVNVPRKDWGTAFKGIGNDTKGTRVVDGNRDARIKWTEEELALLWREDLSSQEVADMTGRNRDAIYQKRSKLRKASAV